MDRGVAGEYHTEVSDGGRLYAVILKPTPNDLNVGCQCEQRYCAHLWATLKLVTSGSTPAEALASERWRALVAQASNAATEFEPAPSRELEIYYEIQLAGTAARSGLSIGIRAREKKQTGGWGTIKQAYLRRPEVSHLPEVDREIIERLTGLRSAVTHSLDPLSSDLVVTAPATAVRLLEVICATGRAFLGGTGVSHPVMLNWDAGDPWKLALTVERVGELYVITGRMRRGAESMSLLEARWVSSAGILCIGDRLARFQSEGALSWISILRKEGQIPVPLAQGHDLVAELLKSPHAPPVEWPQELQFREELGVPVPRAVFRDRLAWHDNLAPLTIEPRFVYEGRALEAEGGPGGLFVAEQRRFLKRDLALERELLSVLDQIGARRVPLYEGGVGWEVPSKRVAPAVRALIKHGWQVEFDGKTFRRSTGVDARVQSGIDWFELHGSVRYGDGLEVGFPQLLQALERGDQFLTLPDGTVGMVPDEFLEQYGSLLRLGRREKGHIRYAKSQASLLDVMLMERGEVPADETFFQLREGLRRFEGLKESPQPKHFIGELRHYQREGLHWLEFLRDTSLGGCLADEMGVGKTPQVLALLERRREEKAGASLVVVPRSLVYNWIQEAARFTPKLRVLDYSTPDRRGGSSAFGRHDLVLTTYGMLRTDIAQLAGHEFDYAILDEAQAIKNAASESAKAARLLKARHRLVMTGTPIENHLGELWSLFEFLNPGMLGAMSAFQKGTASLRNPTPETRKLLSRALQPFILRRTKQQVTPELPPKLEQTIFCEMGPEQRKLYDEMRDHYRGSLLGRVSRFGMAKSKMHVLEALLRLRQAACHPGLLDRTRTADSSAKFESLLPQLEEVREGGHKAIVFSQFTSLLSILREQLDKAGVAYEYLDGKTKDRQSAVERFQGDEKCGLFLVSLKAGGMGLNLTAAEYVFLLDPWWNPAVESQAIDRAHRIGQEKPVFAYRLIARNTVEEKVLELQRSKKELADAIIGEDNRLIGNLDKEELELLLS